MFCARLLGDARDQLQFIDGHSQIRTEISLPSGPTVVNPSPSPVLFAAWLQDPSACHKDNSWTRPYNTMLFLVGL